MALSPQTARLTKEGSAMPEQTVCTYCYKVIDREKEDYCVPNKTTAQSKEQWEYAHVACYQKQMQQYQ